jgi:hypothetical protein
LGVAEKESKNRTNVEKMQTIAFMAHLCILWLHLNSTFNLPIEQKQIAGPQLLDDLVAAGKNDAPSEFIGAGLERPGE